MKYIKSLSILILSAGILAGCVDTANSPIDSDGTPPGPLANVNWEPTRGGAVITYDLPSDDDLLYAMASYVTKAGVTREFKASLYSNRITIEGIGDTDTYKVSMYAVDRSENRSQPVLIDIIPDTPPVVAALESMEVIEDFGGITVTFENDTAADLVFEVFTANEDGEMENIENFYTALKTGTFSVRGYLDTPREFQIRVRDKYNNYSDTFTETFTPIFEVLLDKSRFSEMKLPGDSDCTSWGCAMEYIWDGRISADSDGRTGAHTGSESSVTPKYFTFDMGVAAKLSRFQLWPIQDDKHYFNDVSPRRYEVWGCTEEPAADGSWDNWILMLEIENIKPSGYPVGSLSEDDRIAGQNGDSANFPADLPNIRYIRIRCHLNWSGNTNMTFTEVSFWGDDGSSSGNGR